MYDQGNTLIMTIIVLVLLVAGYYWHMSSYPKLAYYSPAVSYASYYPNYHPTSSSSSSSYASSSKSYSYSAPSSYTTSYVYYPGDMYTPDPNQNCYVSWSDGYNTMTTCEYMQ